MQTYVDDSFDENHNAYDDLQNIENNFAALKSNFSGVSSPPNAVAGMDWFDSDNHVNKRYDAGWLGLMHGDLSQKIWVYRNDSIPGWVIDSSVSDCVLAAKGGGVYGTAGGTAGSWVHGHGFNDGVHNHQWAYYMGDTDRVRFYQTDGSLFYPILDDAAAPQVAVASSGCVKQHLYTANAQYELNGSVTDNSSWRPAAAVNTLQVLNI